MQMMLSLSKRRSIAATLKELTSFMREVINEFLTDNCPHLAASISYYLFFSIFPLTLAAVSVLGFMSKSPDVANRVIEAIGDFIPVSSSYITTSIEGVVRTRGATGAIATIGLLWGGSSVFNAVRKSLNAAWGIRVPRPFLVERALELGMMAGLGLLLLLSFGITTLMSIMRQSSLEAMGSGFFSGDTFWHVLFIMISIGLSFMAFLLLYRFVPNTRVRWSDVWGGALLAALAFEAAKQIFILYVTSSAHFNLIYGTLGWIIALLLWTYVSAVILLFCAKLTSVYSRTRTFSVDVSSWKRKRRLKRNTWPIDDPIDHLTPPGSTSHTGTDAQKRISRE